DQRFQTLRGFDETCTDGRIQTEERMARKLALDHATFFHQSLAGEQATLTILVINEGEPALVSRKGFLPLAGQISIHDLPDSVRIPSTSHRARCTGFEIRKQ